MEQVKDGRKMDKVAEYWKSIKKILRLFKK